MINEGILSQLREMKLDGMVKELTHQLEHPEEFSHLSFQERLGLLVSAEWSRKKTNRINRYITQAKFSIPSATIDAIEYYPDRCLDRLEQTPEVGENLKVSYPHEAGHKATLSLQDNPSQTHVRSRR